MVGEMAHAVVALHGRYREEADGGRLHWVINASTAQWLQRAYITHARDGEYRVRLEHGDLSGVALTVTPRRLS